MLVHTAAIRTDRKFGKAFAADVARVTVMAKNPIYEIEHFWTAGPFCWNCELLPDAIDDDTPVYFCSPLCSLDFHSKQPLRNLLAKRRWRVEHGKPPWPG